MSSQSLSKQTAATTKRLSIGRFSWRMLLRDWRGGELSILSVALVIAVTSVTAVGFFTDRVERGLKQQAAELIAADLVITSSRPLPEAYQTQAAQGGLKIAHTTQFRSVVLASGAPQLVEVKAVTAGYPLRGKVRIADAAYADDTQAVAIPAVGKAWVEPRLLQLLNIGVGDQLQLGSRSLQVTKVLTYEPDRGGDLYSVAPRLMINQQDLAASKLIQNGALVKYRLLLAGERVAVDRFASQLSPRLQRGEQLLTVQQGRPELRNALDSAQRFLALAALISVLLAGIAVATVAHRFAQRHRDTSAMLRCLGATQATVLRIFSLEMLWLALIASSVGCGLGLLTQFGISQILDKLLLTHLPPPSFKPLLPGYATGVVLLLGFAMPPLLALKNVPPLRVLRRAQAIRGVPGWQVYLAVLLSMAVLLRWQIGEWLLVLYVLGGLLVTLLILAAAAWVVIALLKRLRQRVGVAWRFGLANIARRPRSSMIQIVAFGLGIMIMLLLSTIRSDMLREWRNSLPPDAANHFLINVQPDQVAQITAYFKMNGLTKLQLFPMVRARLVSINGQTVSSDDYPSEHAKHLVTREFNLSWAAQPQVDNEIVAGRWWTAADYGKSQLSLEIGIAKTLNIALHDTLGFDLNGSVKTFKVTSLRSVDWSSFNINFFTVVPPKVLQPSSASWVTSIYLNHQQKQQLAELVKRFPNVTVIDVEVIMQRVRVIMDRVALAVEFIFLFTLLAGLAVLYAAIQANQDERRFENAVLRTLGARRAVLLRGLIAEFVTLGAVAGLLAGLSATSLAWVLAHKVFHFDYSLDLRVALVGVVTGVLVVGTAGVLGTRKVLQHPPIETLREGEG